MVLYHEALPQKLGEGALVWRKAEILAENSTVKMGRRAFGPRHMLCVQELLV